MGDHYQIFLCTSCRSEFVIKGPSTLCSHYHLHMIRGSIRGVGSIIGSPNQPSRGAYRARGWRRVITPPNPSREQIEHGAMTLSSSSKSYAEVAAGTSSTPWPPSSTSEPTVPTTRQGWSTSDWASGDSVTTQQTSNSKELELLESLSKALN